MKLLRSIVQVILLLLFIAIGTNVCDDRCSRNLDGNEILWEEVVSTKEKTYVVL